MFYSFTVKYGKSYKIISALICYSGNQLVFFC